jgi:hypothetical protein
MSYFTKIGKTITNKFQTIIKKSENGNFYAKQKDKKKYAMFF